MVEQAPLRAIARLGVAEPVAAMGGGACTVLLSVVALISPRHGRRGDFLLFIIISINMSIVISYIYDT